MARTPQRPKAERPRRGSAPRQAANKTAKAGTKAKKPGQRRAKSPQKNRAPLNLAMLRQRIDRVLDHAGGRFGIGIGIGLLLGLFVVLGFNRFNHWVTDTPDGAIRATGQLATPAINDTAKPVETAPAPAIQPATPASTAANARPAPAAPVGEKTLDQLINDTQSEITEPEAVPVTPPAASQSVTNPPVTNSSVAPAPAVKPSVPTPSAPAVTAPKPAPTIAAVPMTPTPRDGDQPAWLRNAVVFHAPSTGPMIAIVLDDVGVNKPDAELALDLPSPITLSMMTYADNVGDLAARAKAKGHELMLHVPMQPVNPRIDPGPNALLVGLSADEVKRRLDWGLSRFSGFIGINNHMGSRFTQDEAGMRVVMHELQSRGLLFLDSRTIPNSVGERMASETGVPHVGRDVFLDDDMSADAVARQLAAAERVATRQGYVIAIGHPHPVTVAVLRKWMVEAKQRGFVLVPLSTVAKREIGVPG